MVARYLEVGRSLTQYLVGEKSSSGVLHLSLVLDWEMERV